MEINWYKDLPKTIKYFIRSKAASPMAVLEFKALRSHSELLTVWSFIVEREWEDEGGAGESTAFHCERQKKENHDEMKSSVRAVRGAQKTL